MQRTRLKKVNHLSISKYSFLYALYNKAIGREFLRYFGRRQTLLSKNYSLSKAAVSVLLLCCWVTHWMHISCTLQSPLILTRIPRTRLHYNYEMAGRFFSSGPNASLNRPNQKIKWFHIPVSVGIGVIAFVQIRRIWKDQRIQRGKEPTSWQSAFLKQLPTRGLSRAFGALNQREFPNWMRLPLLNLYIRTYGCNMREAEIEDVTQYRTLSQLFQRRLKNNARTIDNHHPLVSPCDGRVLHYGTVSNNLVDQVKGVTYSLSQFVGPNVLKPEEVAAVTSDGPTLPKKHLYFITLYLAPGDYHHFHSPANWRVHLRRHFPGQLLPVSPWAAKLFRGLFTLNERVLLKGEWDYGLFTFTAIGAFNVGSIFLQSDSDLQTNVKGVRLGDHNDKEYKTENCFELSKGDHIGGFNLGSTIVLIFEGPRDFNFVIRPQQKVKYGEPLGSHQGKYKTDH